MGRKTIILREDQFNEICGTNTAYLDNNSDYKEDGTTTTKTAGAVSDFNGEKEYSEPVTSKDISHEMAPETLWALLFRNGGHGLWGHWGSGLRAKELNESNSELEGRSWNGNSYTNLTTKKTELKQQLDALVKQNAPKQQIQSVKSALAGVCAILNRETGAIKGRKTAMKNLGFNNQFQKAGGHRESGNGKAHSKKTKDPNVGTGYITYT
jgi:hypothetical protein